MTTEPEPFAEVLRAQKLPPGPSVEAVAFRAGTLVAARQLRWLIATCVLALVFVASGWGVAAWLAFRTVPAPAVVPPPVPAPSWSPADAPLPEVWRERYEQVEQFSTIGDDAFDPATLPLRSARPTDSLFSWETP